MTAKPHETRSGHIPPLDGLRGCAILLVLAFHFSAFDGASSFDRAVFRYLIGGGWAGVDLFFVLSGFLITGILLRTKNSPDYLRNFFVRRVLRIFPLYFAYLLIRFLLLPLRTEGWSVPGDIQLWFWTYLSNVYFAIVHWSPAAPASTLHLWSLAVEEQFYIFWPICVLLCSRRQLLALVVAMLVGAPILRTAALMMGVDPVAIYVLTPTRIDTLAAGALIALMMSENLGRTRLLKWTPFAAVASIGGLALAVFLDRRVDALGPWMQVIGFSALAVLFASLLVATLSRRVGERAIAVLSQGVLPVVGRYSYSMYLFHMLVLYALNRVGFTQARLPLVFGSQLPAYVVFAVVGMAVTFGVGALTWFTIERYFLALKDRLARYDAPLGSPAPGDGELVAP